MLLLSTLLILALVPASHAQVPQQIRIPVESWYNSQFAATISFSLDYFDTDDTYLRVLLDTSSSDFWVPSSDCWAVSGSRWCMNHDRFNARESSRYTDVHRNFTTSYSTAEVSGKVGMNDVTIGQTKLMNKEFGEALKVGELDDYINMWDGVLGLGTSSSASMTPVVLVLHYGALIADPLYSFIITRVAKDKPEIVGELVLGVVDQAAFTGEMAWGAVLTDDSWTTQFDSVAMGDTQIATGEVVVECSSSNPLLVGPNSQVQKIYELLDAQAIPAFTVRSVDCEKVNTFPSLKFVLNGVTVEIQANDYVVQETVAMTKFCYLSITAYEDPQEEKWVFGAMVHKPLYIVYKFGADKKLGFAQARLH